MRVVDKPEALRLLETWKRGLRDASCLPCALLREAEPNAHVIAAHEHGVVLLNQFAQRRGHLMVVSRRHVEHAHELGWNAYSELQHLAYDAALALQRVLTPARVFSAVLGSSAALATSYPHLHIHVCPVFETDERARPARVFSWSEGVVVYEEHEARALAQSLREAFSSNALP